MTTILRPGPGWTKLSPAVYDHAPTGIRIHLHGIYRNPQSVIVDGDRWPESQRFNRFVRIAGGNRKRGTMLWALNHHREATAAPETRGGP